MLTINSDIDRRFILGKQGLWPGRRWRNIEGTAQAMRAMEYLQLDPLQIIARSQDINLHSRVLNYTVGEWENLTYQQGNFFDWGDRLVARFDSKLNRPTNTFVILGLWLENNSLAKDEAFAEALARGFGRFVTKLGANMLDANSISEPLLRRCVNSRLRELRTNAKRD